MVDLENEYLKVKVNSKGAELTSFVDKETGTEYIWQGDKQIWPYHAPNLFPIVGGLNNDTLNVDGKNYPLSRHGFARTSTFRRIESSPIHAQFALSFDAETLKLYPYKFELQVVFHLENRSLKVMYKVINKDEKRIYFSVGAHPAFNVPLVEGENYEDYYLQFEKQEDADVDLLNNKGLFNGEKSKYLIGDKLHLTKEMFNNDALVFKTLKSRKVTLKNTDETKKVKLDFSHFSQLGIWAKPGAPFVCIEPWLGYADSDGANHDISKKEGIQHVEHGHVFEVDYSISI